MARTYPHRREWILDANAERTVQETVTEYPLLKKGTYVSVNITHGSFGRWIDLYRTQIHAHLHNALIPMDCSHV